MAPNTAQFPLNHGHTYHIKDLPRALELFRAAAQQNHAAAQCNLGVLYGQVGWGDWYVGWVGLGWLGWVGLGIKKVGVELYGKLHPQSEKLVV